MTIFTSKKTMTIILVALVLIVIALGVLGVYRGFKDASVTGDIRGSSGESVEVQAADTEISTDATNEGVLNKEENSTDSELQNVLSDKPDVAGIGDQDFFINYRLDRERVRGQQVELLQSVIGDANSDTAVRTQAQSKLLRISDSMDQELQLEALVKAKGFTEAALFVQEKSATAVLKKKGMSDHEVSTVADIISQVTGIKLENIVVIPK